MENTVERVEFETTKKKMIEALEALKFEEGPHVIQLISRGHQYEPDMLKYCCNGYSTVIGLHVIENSMNGHSHHHSENEN